MAKYRFSCPTCNTTVERYTPSNISTVPCKTCQSDMRRLLPNVGSKKVLEVVDKFTNVKHEENQKKQLEERRTKHFWDVEVPRLVQTYSVETCLQEGWLVYNERGELVINKPPDKR